MTTPIRPPGEASSIRVTRIDSQQSPTIRVTNITLPGQIGAKGELVSACKGSSLPIEMKGGDAEQTKKFQDLGARLTTLWDQVKRDVENRAAGASDLKINLTQNIVSYRVGSDVHYITLQTLDPSLKATVDKVQTISKELWPTLHPEDFHSAVLGSSNGEEPFQIASEHWRNKEIKTPKEFFTKSHFGKLAMFFGEDRERQRAAFNTIISFIVYKNSFTQSVRQLIEAKHTQRNNLQFEKNGERKNLLERELRSLEQLLFKLESTKLDACYIAAGIWGDTPTDASKEVRLTRCAEAADFQLHALTTRLNPGADTRSVFRRIFDWMSSNNNRYLGELNLLLGMPHYVCAYAHQTGDLLRSEREEMLRRLVDTNDQGKLTAPSLEHFLIRNALHAPSGAEASKFRNKTMDELGSSFTAEITEALLVGLDQAAEAAAQAKQKAGEISTNGKWKDWVKASKAFLS